MASTHQALFQDLLSRLTAEAMAENDAGQAKKRQDP